MTKVGIGRTVTYKDLERALLEAAKELGWKARVQDKFSTEYRLGSVQKVQEYDGTRVFLRGSFLPTMQVIINSKSPTDRFYVWSGAPFGVALPFEVRKYLEAVSRHLPQT